MIKCPKCGGMMYEDDDFVDENGQVIQEISCFKCPKKFYINQKEYRVKLADIAKKRNLA